MPRATPLLLLLLLLLLCTACRGAARALAAPTLARLHVADAASFPTSPPGRDVQVTSCGVAFTVRDAESSSHLEQLAREFGADQYGLCGTNLTRAALDVGANVGAFALQVLLAFPGAHVYSVEPLPENRAFYVHNMRANGVPAERYTLLEGGLSSDGRPFRISYDASNSFGSQRREGGGGGSGGGDAGSHVVRTTTLDTLLDEVGPVDVLKLDCEGCEYEVLMSSRHVLDPAWVRLLKGEAHGPWKFDNAPTDDMRNKRAACLYAAIAADKQQTRAVGFDC